MADQRARPFVGNDERFEDLNEANNDAITKVMGHKTWEEYISLAEADEDQLVSLTANAARPRKSHPKIPACGVDLSAADREKMGTMHVLPNEMFDCLVNRMDFQTVIKFGQASRFSHLMVHRNVNWRLVLRRCPHLVTWARKMHSVNWINLLNVREELLHRECRGCGGIGQMISLFTGERICNNCNGFNKRYWSIDLSYATQAFGLEAQQLLQIPYARLGSQRAPNVGKRIAFLIRDVYNLAVTHYGSIEEMKQAGEEISPDKSEEATPLQLIEARMFRWMRKPEPASGPRVFDDPDRVDPSAAHHFADHVALPFPIIKNVQADPETFYRCDGCRWAITHNFLPDVGHFLYMGIDPRLSHRKKDGILLIREEELRTTSDHIVHTRTCIGAGLKVWNNFASPELKSEFV